MATEHDQFVWLIGQFLDSYGVEDPILVAEDLLSRKPEWRCPHCRGSGMTETGAVDWEGNDYYRECSHPNCFTIGGLLTR